MKAVEITIKGKTISHIKVLHMDSWGDNEHEERDCCYVVYDDYGEDGQKMTDCVMYFSVWDIESIELK